MIALELKGHVALPYHWKGLLFHRGCSSNVTWILDTGLPAGGRESKEGRQRILLTESTWTHTFDIKYVDTKNQLADILTKGNFTCDEWK